MLRQRRGFWGLGPWRIRGIGWGRPWWGPRFPGIGWRNQWWEQQGLSATEQERSKEKESVRSGKEKRRPTSLDGSRVTAEEDERVSSREEESPPAPQRKAVTTTRKRRKRS
jgi:hypothetical protein